MKASRSSAPLSRSRVCRTVVPSYRRISRLRLEHGATQGDHGEADEAVGGVGVGAIGDGRRLLGVKPTTSATSLI